MNFPISDILVYRLLNGLSVNEHLDLFFRITVSLLHQFPDDAVAGSVGPVGLREGLGLGNGGIHVIANAPGIVHL